MRKAIFLDKDGTLIKNIPYNVDLSKIFFFPEVANALSYLQKSGFTLVIITNQSGISKKYFTKLSFEKVINYLGKKFLEKGVKIKACYYCPHSEKESCECRKPNPGLFFKASKELDINLEDSWMIGDALDDIEAGKRAGCKTVMIDRKNEVDFNNTRVKADVLAGDLDEAARIIAKDKI